MKKIFAVFAAAALLASAACAAKDAFSLAHTGTVEEIKAAVEDGTIVINPPKGTAPLYSAVSWENLPAVEYFLSAGADVNHAGNSGATALMEAARSGSDARMVNMLLAAGADIKARNKDGATAMHMACRYKCAHDVVDSLLAAGADLDARDKNGRTPLMYALSYDKPQGFEQAKYLISKGANVNALDDFGRGVLHNARNAERVKYLLDLGIKPASSNTGVTPVMSCIDDPASVKLLLEAGDSAAAATQNGVTALMYAAGHRKPESAKLLLAAGADVNARTADTGYTPLIYAARTSNLDVLKLYIAAGADVNAVDSKGWTALTHAAAQGMMTQYFEALLDAGADAQLAFAALSDADNKKVREATRRRVEEIAAARRK